MNRSALPQAWDGCDPGPEHPLEQRLRAICLRRFTADRLLRDLDDVAMHHGKEARVPFLAAPVLAHAQSLDLLDLFPRGLTADGGDYRSSPLKQHVVDAALGLLPRGSCLGRRKQGFILPLDLITAGPLSERLSRALSPSRSPVASLIDLDLLHALRRRSSHGDHTFEDWLLLALAEWLGSLDRCLGLTGVLPQVKLQSAFAIGGM
jgi:asparagine synthetase B (glutamine-hydrolysing)